MSSGKAPAASADDEPESPTSTRHPVSGHTPDRSLADEPQPPMADSPDTIRPARPQNRAAGNYGSFASTYVSSPEQTGERRTQEVASGAKEPPRWKVSETGTVRQAMGSTDKQTPPRPTRMPTFSRRSTSNLQGAVRRQEFSVDDDTQEVESDMAQRHGSVAKTASGSLRHQSSTLRRRPTAPHVTLQKVDSGDGNDDEEQGEGGESAQRNEEMEGDFSQESLHEQEGSGLEDGEEEDGDLSDPEDFTLKDRQEAINETHPFGIRIWKPALYKKNRSVEKSAEGDIHSAPGGHVTSWLWLFNILWSILVGWWLALVAFIGALVCFAFAFAPGGVAYGRALRGLAGYLLYPFGKFVKLEQDEAYLEEDEGEGRSISEYEQWQSGDLEDGRLFFGPVTNRSLVGRRRNSVDSVDENDSLLGRSRRGGAADDNAPRNKRRLFGRGQWTLGRVIFFIFFYGAIAPLLLLISLCCWLLVFTIPMGRVTLLLFYHLRRHPLALSFHSDTSYTRRPGSPSSILLCTYRAAGLKYWKYTIDGTNIFLINLMAVVIFVIFDYWVLDVTPGIENGITHPATVFTLALFSIIPLAYFIGQAVASISAQSSMGVGSVINAFFSTVVEVFLYCVALKDGKGQLVEGSVIGSIFAGIMLLPGISMCFGAIKRKTQRFNARSAGVTSTMLLFAVIGAFGPTLFYQIYGTHELNCMSCVESHHHTNRDCRRCYFSQVPAVSDRFYLEAVRPYCWFAAAMLFLSYVIGLWFTLRTHAAVIWNMEVEEKKSMHPANHPELDQSRSTAGNEFRAMPSRQHSTQTAAGVPATSSIKETQLYKRILGHSLKQMGMPTEDDEADHHSGHPNKAGQDQPPHIVPPKSAGGDSSLGDNHSQGSIHISGLSEEENQYLVRGVTEIAATAASVAARDAAKVPRRVSAIASSRSTIRPHPHRTGTFHEEQDGAMAAEPIAGTTGGGHDAPNWSRVKSTVVLLGATLLYAIIAEILVDTVDVVLSGTDIDEKFLGITLFALVPNTTEFLNAISFAMNGNIALSMEIGSAYALQVCLLQVPALVLFSAVYGRFVDPGNLINHTFSLIFPQWDMVTVILCVFLLSYMYGEGKSNYFKGSILILSYLVVMLGFYFSGRTDMDIMGVNRFDTLALGEAETFKTIGRGTSGIAY